MDAFLGQLKAFTQNLAKEVCDMQMQFGRERSHMKQHMDEELKSFMGRLKSFASGLDDDVTQMRKGFHQARSEMIARLQLELGGFTNELKTTVGSILEAFRSDRQGARNAWMGKGHAAPKPEAPKPQEAFEQNYDDLIRISGIGAAKQELLNRAGIHTFAQLAQSTPEQLYQILGKQGGPAKFEDWISQAESMAH
jgi:predicted flap endonuclease-1-like 5' DNA nuclease